MMRPDAGPALLSRAVPMAGMNVEEKASMSRFALSASRQSGAAIALIEPGADVSPDRGRRAVIGARPAASRD